MEDILVKMSNSNSPSPNADSGKTVQNNVKKSNTIQAPSISLPKGGGAIKGISEKFTANPVTGTGSMTIPIAVSPGRSDFGPKLSLAYDSGAGNGPFGFGWSLSLPSITRKTDKGLPKYRDDIESDTFILSGTEDLVPILKIENGNWIQKEILNRKVHGITYAVTQYRPRIEGLFARIERWTNINDPTDSCWRSISKENITTWYGRTSNSRIADPDYPGRIYSWLICESHDDKGNIICYKYKPENSYGVNMAQMHEQNRSNRSSNRYIKRIQYGNRTGYFPKLAEDEHWPSLPAENDWLFEVVFDYGEHDPDIPLPVDNTPEDKWKVRADAFSSCRSGFEVRTYRLCQRVLMFHHCKEELGREDYLVRSTEFSYTESPVASFIKSITQSGFVLNPDGTYLKQSLPRLEFTYSEVKINHEIKEIQRESLENLPAGVDGSAYQFVDLNGEGISGILTDQGEAWYYKPAKGKAGFGPLQVVKEKPSLSSLHTGWQLLDLAGDGKLDVADFSSPVPGFYERTDNGSWDSFKAFRSLPVIDYKNPNLRFVDLNGDGHADILLTGADRLTWYPSKAEEGFAQALEISLNQDEEKSPRLVFQDQNHSVYLADMSGDGLSDIVRIRNGEVCYWPNLGYGRFGAKVTMDNSPWFDSTDLFQNQRIKLADIDGSGTTDIIYLYSAGIKIFYNQSGNSFRQEENPPPFPPVDTIASIQTADLFGDGTTCLVWSSPLPGNASSPMKYIDLMGGQKPHLLIKSVNNLGAETEIEYASSTEFYLKDKEKGTPWITRLPFPVYVVKRVKTYDRISRNLFTTRYAYHHGYFDGEEREFRGFGMVEQWDTEDYEHNAEQPASNRETEYDLPPVHTKTWFHTGVYKDRSHISDFFAGIIDENDNGEYFREPGLTDSAAEELLLPDTILPQGLSAEEECEACRALKGSMLRQEVYAADKSEKADYPYTVIEQNFTIQCLQNRGTNEHAVFFVHPREAITYNYERNPVDPRISHALTLETDEFGNVTRAVSIGYGRRQNPGLAELSVDEQKKQTQILITYTESDYTDKIDRTDAWHTPLPAEVRTSELTGFSPLSGTRFSWTEFYNEDYGLIQEIPYETEASARVKQKRLIERVRTLYCKHDQAGVLPLCRMETPVLPYETCKQAFTPGLLSDIFGEKTSGHQLRTCLESDGKYRDLDMDENWWIPSGRQHYDPDKFYLPVRYIDPFGNTHVMEYDQYLLLMKQIDDPLGNRVCIKNNYRVLQSCLVTDPNGNRNAAAFDALGLVAGTAVMGKPGEDEGDNLDGFTADLSLQDISDFFQAPRGNKARELLGNATTRIIYDLHCYSSNKDRPVYAATIVRETHVNDLEQDAESAIQVSFSYSDGFGREVQKKIQAEPGLAPERDHATGKIITINRKPEMTVQADPRWVGSGWTIFNNKGKPVRQFEPFFTDKHEFEFDVQIGVSPILIYDPADRVIATLHPNHTYEKVVFDPWKQTTWDVNDTVLSGPADDPDIKGFIEKIDPAEFAPAWHTVRTDDALLLSEWPDSPEYPENPGIRIREKQAAKKTEIHADTPTVTHFDSLGRVFLTIEHNRYEKDRNGNPAIVNEILKTRVELDSEGNQRRIIDAKDRIVMKYDYDMLGTVIHQQSMEAGERWIINNVAGKPVCQWNSRGFRIRTAYDELIRPLAVYVQENTLPEFMSERLVYGEYHPDRLLNLRTKLYQHFDQSGVITNAGYDFKGNLTEASKQFALVYKTNINWNVLEGVNEPDEIAEKSGPLLMPEEYVSFTRFDALNRPIQLVTPHTNNMKPNVIQPRYNEANLLEAIDVRIRNNNAPESLLDPDRAARHIVENIDYNAKGQRELIKYGNGSTTYYAYDFFTFRLTHLFTTRKDDSQKYCKEESDPTERSQLACPKEEPLCKGVQNLFYTYDPVGNITSIRDDAQQTVFFNNKCIEPNADYTYDSLYRLISATGREHVGQTTGARNTPDQPSHNDSLLTHLPHPHDGNAMDNYTELYEYDNAGNIMTMIHQAGAGGWTRHYAYNEASLIEPHVKSNRLSATSLPGDNAGGPYHARYTHDEHGNMKTMPHLPVMHWDYKDQLQAASQQVVNDGTPETTWYVYNAAGERVRKITEGQAGAGNTPKRMKERLYLGGFEIYREYNADGTTIVLERESLSVMDDKKRVALIETKTFEAGVLNRLRNMIGNPEPLIRYQFDNHLGSACLELDEDARIISYEEYFPYGNTSFQSVASGRKVPAKRYRYTGKERDEESGLDYYGARYYASWLGRWTACDPAGLVDGGNLYWFVRGNPVRIIDPNGKSGEKPPIQLHLIEQFIIETKATIAGYSQEKMIQKFKKNIAILWGENPDDYEVGHHPNTPQWSTPPGQTQRVGPQHKLANREQSLQEAKDRRNAAQKGQYTRSNRKHVGAPIPNPKPTILPEPIKRLSLEDPDEVSRRTQRPSTPSMSKPATMPETTIKTPLSPPEQLSIDFEKPKTPTPSLPADGVSPRSPQVNVVVDKATKEAPGKLAKLFKGVGEVLVKKGAKIIPFVGIGVGAGFAAKEAASGNYAAAFVEAAGASEIPIVAQVADVASLASDIAGVAKDVLDPEQKLEDWYWRTFLK
ncbi:MAG: VCBS repeat-containing protein [Spirochaetales bacterium]|nr:VCBS repeat-containing protein [Spirochaetales bacterium]